MSDDELFARLPPPGGRLLIEGRWQAASDNSTFEVACPSTGRAIAEAVDATVDDARAAAATATAAAPAWAASDPIDRSRILQRIGQDLRIRADRFAGLITAEAGKPLAESHGEVAYAASYFDWFASQVMNLRGRYARSPFGLGRIAVEETPVGPCVLVVPWNFPLVLTARKVATAIAAGCTFVVKPADLTPLSSIALMAAALDAGLPPTVGSLVTTTRPAEVVDALLTAPGIAKLSFTGSTAVGRQLAARAGERLLRASMELGGNAPFIVCDDADIDAAVEGAVAVKLRNAGQVCTAANRFLVHERVYVEFVERLAVLFDDQVVGPGNDPSTTMGPVINSAAKTRIDGLVDTAAKAGAQVSGAKGESAGSGYFVRPRLLADVDADSALLAEEIFGPVAPVVPFKCHEDALGLANRTPAGLAAYVYSSDPATLRLFSDGLHVGMVGLNRASMADAAAPFGGVKDSGFGREGGYEGLSDYLEPKYVATY